MGPQRDYKYSPSNYNAQINSPIFLDQLFQTIGAKTKRELRKEERAFIINKVRTLDPLMLEKYPQNVLVDNLADILSKKLRVSVAYGSLRDGMDVIDQVDMHEYIKANIGTTSEQNPEYAFKSLEGFGDGNQIDKFLGTETPMKLCRQLNPLAQYRRNYIVLDSRYRISTLGPITNFSWDFIPNLTLTNGSVNIYGVIRDLMEMRVYPLRIPYLPLADNEQQRISLNIAECSPQGFVAHENRRFLFMFHSTIMGNWIDCDPFKFNDGYYRFQKPLTRLDRLTISFGNPLQALQFDADRSIYNMTYGILNTLVTTPEAHNLITGSLVYFNDFTTTNPTVDSPIIDIINQSQGHYITFISATSFTIPVNTSALSPLPPGFNPIVYYGSKRFYIPLELTYIEPE